MTPGPGVRDGAAIRPAGAEDGRTLRRLRNRDRIIDVALDLARAGEDVTVERLAEASSISVRSIYNHFPSGADLESAMHDRGKETLRPYLTAMPGREVPFDERVRRFAEVRGRMFEEFGAMAWRAAVEEDRRQAPNPFLERWRRGRAREIRTTFPEIVDDRARAAVTALADPLGWRLLRVSQRLSFAEACAVIEDAVRRARTPLPRGAAR